VLKRIEEFKICIEMTGFKNVRIRSTKEFLEKVNRERPLSVEVQFFDAGYVATWRHLYFAALNALTAFSNEKNVSKSLAMETLLYAAGDRQITKATDRMGIKPASRHLAVLIVGKENRTIRSAFSIVSKNIDGQRDEKVLDLSKEKMAAILKTFEISRIELMTVMERDDVDMALVDLVIERMALLSTEH
jgi:KEOPS complex subunit Cgi121